MKKIALYGGSFDPVHFGHLAIARTLLVEFALDEFVFIPAYQAPHKLQTSPTPAFDRFAMLSLATQNDPAILVSRIEVEMPDRPFSVETLSHLAAKLPDDELYFIMGADSWMDITTWREWELVLSLTNHIVVSRPSVEINTDHVTDNIRKRIIDLRRSRAGTQPQASEPSENVIYITDSVNYDISATDIRRRIRDNDLSWRDDVPAEVAKYIEKYQIYR